MSHGIEERDKCVSIFPVTHIMKCHTNGIIQIKKEPKSGDEDKVSNNW